MENNSTMITKTLNELPEKFRVPIYLKYYEGFSHKDIATSLSMNHSTIRSNVKRGLEQLSMKLRSKGIALSTVSLSTLLAQIDLKANEGSNISQIMNQAIEKGTSKRKHTRPSRRPQPRPRYLMNFLIGSSVVLGVLGLALYQSNRVELLDKMKKVDTVAKTEELYHWDFRKGVSKDFFIKSFNNDAKPSQKKEELNQHLIHPKNKILYSEKNDMQINIFINKPMKHQIVEFDLQLVLINFSKILHSANPSLAFSVGFSQRKTHLEKTLYQRNYTFSRYSNRSKAVPLFYKYVNAKAYLFKNYVVLMIEGRLQKIIQYGDMDGSSRPVIALKNFGIKQITMKTIPQLPKIINEYIDGKKNNNTKKIVIDVDRLEQVE